MKTAYLSCRCHPLLAAYLRQSGYTLHPVQPHGMIYDAVDAHADMYYCKMGVTRHCHLFKGDIREIGRAYPHDIPFNAVCLDNYLIHNLTYTSPALLNEARSLGMTLVNVRQGYTKCNCVVVDGHSLITADEGILRQLKKIPDVSVLPIRQGFVRLEGFEYGFLGGASGRVGDEIIFNGDLSSHPDDHAIRQFIESRGLTVKYFPEYPLTDIGSIIEG